MNNSRWLKTSQILKNFKVFPRKRFGQHFLVNFNILRKIVEIANISPDDVVLEVGSGVGNLTYLLSQKARLVLGIEFDKNLLPVLNEVLQGQPNVKIFQGDALRLNLKELFKGLNFPNKLVSNLPYNIATPLIVSYLKTYPQIKEMVVTIQKELAQKMIATPKSKSYSALSLKVQFFADPQIVMELSPNVFKPPPKVKSVVMKIVRLTSPKVAVEDVDLFFKIISASFAYPRKTILNSLISSQFFLLSQEELAESLKEGSIDLKTRAEALNLEEFTNLYRTIKTKLN